RRLNDFLKVNAAPIIHDAFTGPAAKRDEAQPRQNTDKCAPKADVSFLDSRFSFYQEFFVGGDNQQNDYCRNDKVNCGRKSDGVHSHSRQCAKESREAPRSMERAHNRFWEKSFGINT